MSVTIAVSWGELVDKITILHIKAERIKDPEKLKNIHGELEAIEEAYLKARARDPEIGELEARLKAANEVIWRNEDDLREWERKKIYGPEFIECARTAYRMNDQRCALKRRINEILGSALVEEKSYTPYE
jgi:hypothetical protein